MFRVRRGFLSGCPILQISLGEREWVDAEVLPDLQRGFHIVSDAWMKRTDEVLAEQQGVIAILKARAKLYDHRSAIARKSRAKKKAPVLTEQIVGEFNAQNANRGPYPRSPQKEAP